MQLLDQPLGKLATEINGATRIFHQHKLDFCCGGQQTLADALAKQQLDAAPILQALEQLQQQPPAKDWRKESAKTLVEHILQRYHQRHREQLPELIRLALRVEQVHGHAEECPLGLAEHLQNMQQELDSHMRKEEQILFPMLQQGIYPSGPIHVMQEEHLQHGEELDKLDYLTNGITLPEGACNTWTALYRGLQELKEDLMEHILLENEVLFVQPLQTSETCCGSCQ
ncbi:iron-sulfur cluster repair protein YtfE [Marinospirillum alkaliphilum]|uniref:Regulator of cell morphogenesis and NO signaling n=1 Tax=Marinospirillum alkaliphilum DSM 21637 TaxID=1122209 RepID=A0A1K1ZPN0_9GAMM|nr:iron-sulfur cluster repair protein YtfE [Marinospirillum alkaliphilum]SFX75429.1 regulator of cell morphogenesis and NO signaling [Marinospirillum alkaliphilum DSM 21637]